MIGIPLVAIAGVIVWYYWRHRSGHSISIVLGVLLGILVGASGFGVAVRSMEEQAFKQGGKTVQDTTVQLQKK